MSKELSILHVEDDELDAEAIRRLVVASGLDVSLKWVTDGGQALTAINEARDKGELRSLVVLLDLNMPRVSGHEFLAKLRHDPTVRRAVVFVVTSSEHRRDVSMAYDQNVAGYFHKDKVSDLLEILKGYQRSATFPSLGA